MGFVRITWFHGRMREKVSAEVEVPTDKIHYVRKMKVDDAYLYLMVDGEAYRIRWADTSPRLANATLTQRKHFEISPSGYGIHWPWLDEDLAITPLLQSAERMMALDSAEQLAGAGI